MNDEILMEAKDVQKTFVVSRNIITRKTIEVHAVNHVDLSVKKGETVGLVGESGCGKSTFGRILLRLIEPTAGELFYRGQDLRKLSREDMRKMRRKLQIIFQDPYASLNPRMTVREAVRAPLDVFGIGGSAERDEKVREILAVVGMDEQQMTRFPHEFSGGQRQRIDIARALILRPEFVVCDEPVSALDVSVRASVLNLMRKLQDEMGLTYLFISHDLSVVRHISDRVAVMYLGSIVEIADKKELYEHPAHPYTKALLAAIPLPDPDRRAAAVPIRGEMPSPYDVPSGCPFHDRCPFCTERCRKERPALRDIGAGHMAACHLTGNN